MENLRENSQRILKLVSGRKYKVASEEISPVIDSIKGNSDEETEILFSLLAARAQCALLLDKNDIVVEDCNRIIKSYHEIRKEPLENDPLQIYFALAHFRLGQVFESKENLVAALGEYSITKKNGTNKEIEQGIKMFMSHIGMPNLSTTDNDIKPYRDLVDLVFDQDEFLIQLLKLKMFLRQNQITDQGAEKLTARNIGKIIIPLMKLFVHNTKVIEALSDFGIQLFIDGVFDFTLMHTLVPSLKDVSSQNLGKIVKYLKLADEESFKKAAEKGLLDILLDHFEKSEFEGPERDALLLSISICNITPAAMRRIATNKKYVDTLFNMKNNVSILAFSRICFMSDCTLYLEDPKNVQFVLDLIDEKMEPFVLSAACVILCRTMAKYDEKANRSFDYSLRSDVSPEEIEFATKVENKLAPVIQKNAKVTEIVANGFLALTFAVRGNKQNCIDKKLHNLASFMLVLHLEQQHICLNCLSFLIYLFENGFSNEIKAIPNIMQNTEKVLDKLGQYNIIMQQSVALLCGLGHPNRMSLMQNAMKRIPDSNVLPRFTKYI
ncbi:hypothetical protein TVAG_299220 [Trichomonas vaginalis G3]|uniref:TPR Domain containing protein n=1 Tax=Trichomonas vaginalis (strain ATCC PRA-98 / G3) TaxID=412133 RepID=A2EVP9_TRIV3|nr:hypothetical protein TVAGG3_0414460 [Trichomonas vaginalis G3]EAY03259.1 hypothetical protein TVAG_299220 [Trichomonas vaginalis G3]KAI5535588.1 hypothetical protein TVAGG3_0414460 [Trichomonas vaginalis G3]|eukprot:XP_001315482.1 hypothetical protein [Trichomonas vaginalis G3]